EVDNPLADWDELDRVADLSSMAAGFLVQHAQEDFADTPVPTLFKNLGKCRRLVEAVRADLKTADESQGMTSPSTAAAAPGGSAQSSAETTPIERTTFHLARRNASAHGHLRGTGFVVEAGSLAAARTAPALRNYPSAATRRDWLIAQGVLQAAPDQPGF